LTPNVIATIVYEKKKIYTIYDSIYLSSKKKKQKIELETHRFGSLTCSGGNVPSEVVRGSFRSNELEELWWISWP
jgi:hypothetical protein